MLGVLTAAAAGARDVPARRHPQDRGPARGRAAGPGRGRQAGQPRHLLHRRRRHRAASCSARSAASPARWSTPTASRSASTTVPTPSPSASASGLRIGRPAADGLPRYVLDISPVTRTVTVGTAEQLDVGRLVGVRPVWTGPPPGVPTACLAQVRAHGDPVAARRLVRGGHPGGRAGRAAARRRARPGRGALRR